VTQGDDSTFGFAQFVANLKPIFEIEKLVSQVIEDMGLGPVISNTISDEQVGTAVFSVLHFVILPQRSAWIDFLLETDRASAKALYKTFSGTTEQSDDDLEDVLRETMNMIHGVLKVAFKEEGSDVIIPVVPQSIASERIVQSPGGYSVNTCHQFETAGIRLRLRIVARMAPITYKLLNELSLANVLAEPLAPEGSDELVLVKKGTMLNKRVLKKVREMADFDGEVRMHPVIDPSPYAKLVDQG
jgi:hypothetical protein